MKDKILKFIKSNFKENDIFSASEIKLNGVDQLTISKALSSLVLSKDIYHLSYGFYCLSIPDEDSLIKGLYKRYIIDDKKVFGVFGGDNYLNNLLGKKLDLNNLVIYSNKVTSGKKNIYIFKHRIVFHKPYVEITSDNAEVLGLLTYVTTASEKELKFNFPILSSMIKKNHLNADEVIDLTPYFPSKTFSKLLKSNLYRQLWKH